MSDPPASLDAEESVLGACMISDRAVETCSDLLEGREFYGLKNGVIYRAILNLYSRGESVDGITVHDQLVRDGTLDKSGGVERVHELAALVPAAANVKHYAEIVRETWIARELVGLGHECIRLGHERPGKSEDLIAQADRKMLELQHLQERRRDTVFTGKQLAEIYLDKLHNPPDDSDGVKPPFSFLKRLQPSRLYVLGAYQKTGKTVLAGQFLKSACEGGARVGVASLEMSHEDVTERVISLFGIPGDQVQAGDVDDAYSERLNEALVAIASWDFEVIDNETLTPHDLMRAQRRGNYDLLIIDHLHHMKIDRRHERESIGENVHGITELARRFEIPVLLLAQLSRGPKEAPFPRPTKRDLYGASQIENYASHIWLVWRRPDEFNDFTSQTEFVIAANRFGWSGRDASRELLFRNRFVRFEEPHQTEGEL